MSDTIPAYATIDAALVDRFGVAAEVARECARRGGHSIQLPDGTRLFVKRAGKTAALKAEASGLSALAAAPGPRVPTPHALCESPRALLLDYIDGGRGSRRGHQALGRALARLHAADPGERRFGFAEDNFIGATEQQNGWRDSWIAFFAERRLGFQLELARARRRIDRATAAEIERLVRRLGNFIDEPDRPSLIHGDLWGGNYLITAEDEPVLIDPAVYFGHREADLAMTELFGGFSPAFYDAYNAELPLDPGYRERVELYNLYHLLNHLNIFGAGYLSGVQSALGRYR